MYLTWCVYYAGKLALQCEREELPQYAGLCWVAAARCESSLGNGSGEAWDVVRAGRQFLTAEISAKDLGCPSPGGEHVQVIWICFTSEIFRVYFEVKVSLGSTPSGQC
jgi:hypothetical protein